MTTITMSYPAFLAACLALGLLLGGLLILSAKLVEWAGRRAGDSANESSPLLGAVCVYFALTALMGVVSALIG